MRQHISLSPPDSLTVDGYTFVAVRSFTARVPLESKMVVNYVSAWTRVRVLDEPVVMRS